MASGTRKPKTEVKPYRRTVDPAGTDPGQAAEIENLVARKKALAGLEPSKPRFGNPVKQIGGAAQAAVRAVMPRTEHTPAEEESFKQRGARAFYEGKIERARKPGGYVSRTAINFNKRGKKP